VLLCGLGGDEIAGGRANPAPEVGDLAVSGHLVRLMARTMVWSGALRAPFTSTLWRNAIVPALPLRLRRTLARRRAASELALYRPEYIARAGLHERLGAALEPLDRGRPGARDQAAGFVTAASQIATGFRRAICAGDVSYPFLHRPLVEFIQAIPSDQRSRPGETRIAQRAAMKDLLPDVIRRRRSKGNPAECLTRAFHRAAGDLSHWLADGLLAQRGYVDPARIRVELSKLAVGAGVTTMPLVKLLSLELWFRALDLRAHALRRTPADSRSSCTVASGALRRGTTAASEGDVTCSTA
jgi:asparagine synthase (glutamine-hydrolysing)